MPITGHLLQDLTNGIAQRVGDRSGVASPAEGALDGCGTYTNEMNNLADGGTGTSSILQKDLSQVMLKQSSRHRPLSPLRILRGIVCLIVLLSTAFMMLVCLSPVVSVLPRLFSVRYSRKMTSFFFSKWLSLWPFLFEKINKTKFFWSGENVPPGERVLLLCNHRTEVDWMYLWIFSIRKGRLGYIKYILKNSLMKLPIFGWGFHILDFIPVERKWEHDELLIREMLSTFLDPLDPLWLVVFPEGTDYTSQQYAMENGLPILKHVLLPETKGFSVCSELLRNSLDKVYDVTIGYKHCCPSFMDNVFGVDPSEVHIHVRQFPLQAIPTSESEAADWLISLFQRKDNLLSDFHAKGHFPNQTVEVDLSVPRCLVNFAFVIIVTSVCTFLTCLSPWFKLYVTLSCIYLTSATYFNIRPFPLLGGKNWTS